MKWNIEWVDLQNVEHMIAECWRMNERQQQSYYKELSRKQELAFAGELGITFLELMYELVNDMADYSWADLQKDVHMAQKLIQDGMQQDDFYWHRQYQELVDEPEFYFYTKMGQAFTKLLAVKLELDISEGQKMVRRDIQRIQEMCEACDWENEREAARAAAFLEKKGEQIFASWLGDGFLRIVQERFGKKAKPVEVLPEPVQEQMPQTRSVFRRRRRWDAANQPNRKKRTASKRLWVFLICTSMGFMGYWLRTQVIRNQGRFEIKQLTAAANAWVHDEPKKAETEPDGVQETALALGSSAVDDAKGALDEDVADTGVGRQPEAVQPEKEDPEEAQPEVLPQYQAFYQEYPDLFGWLKIPDTEIDHPVMQSDDTDAEEKYFYLHHDFAGNKTEEGSLFVDSKSTCYPQDSNTVIYGHNMKNGHNFGMLEQFADPDFCRLHHTIQYDTIYEKGTYEVVAVLKSRILYQEEDGFRYYQFFNYDTKDEFQECVDFVKANQLFDTGKELQYGDKLIMLSTCEYSQENGRLAVVAKRVEA